VERPDGSSNNSFPSGHTANAFMGAEFLYQEYKDVSPWYGIAGYVVATGTGLFRMYNNRHWFSDVVAGAGFGILSTKVAYWIYPWMKEKIFKEKTKNIAEWQCHFTTENKQVLVWC
jgi:membrane-associated phospholipid phosphatase